MEREGIVPKRSTKKVPKKIDAMPSLDDELGIHAPDVQLIQQTRQAIADATYYDERDSGTNFDYDKAAYETVEKNFQKLVLINAWADLMKLSLELMRDGSEQAESSDETLMTYDIESCLEPVIKALTDADLPNKVVIEWCDKMELVDKIGCICNQELQSLRQSRL